MTNEERLAELKRCQLRLRSLGYPDLQERRDVLSEIMPLLNFNEVYYSMAMPIADILGRPFSSTMYSHTFPQIDSILGQAINELEHGITPPPAQPAGLVPTPKLTDEHGILWFWHHCTYQTKWWLAAKAVVAVGAIFSAGFAVGRVNFFVQTWKLLKGQP